MKIQHILVSTDLSEASHRPLPRIRELADRHGAKVTLLHVVPVLAAVPHGAPLAPPVVPADLTDDLGAARAALEQRRERLDWGDVEVEVDAVAGVEIGDAVHRWAMEHDVDLIALSSHGRTGLRRLVLGSVAEDILRHSDVPTLVFPMRGD